MSTIFTYISSFYRTAFRPLYFLLILLMVGSLIYLNYWHALEINYIDNQPTKFGRFIGYYLLYLTPFLIAFGLQPLFFKDCRYYKELWFWIIVLLAPAFFSFRVNFDAYEPWVHRHWNGDDQKFVSRCLGWVIRVFVILFFVFITWYIKDRKNQPFYGTRKTGKLKPYLLMLLIMLPLIMLASTQKDFLAMYPKSGFIAHTSFSAEKWRYLVYELCYGFDFVSIEFFFRGFLILSLLRICGKHCIIPVACFYCMIHFGKPMGEAISSFWGGLLLGIVSFNTRSIWGGLIVHLGIAWMMEVGGWTGIWLQKR